MSPTNGFVGNYSHTREGTTATYQCNDGFRPSTKMTAVCTNASLWVPAPEEQNCVLVTGIHTSTFLIRIIINIFTVSSYRFIKSY